MLFSSDPVAQYINNAFEPVWESVRPVPTVTIDFGNGHTVTRTLHGNIATYLCGADGTVYDILPGIYEPGEYLKQLKQFTLLHIHARQGFVYPGPANDPDAAAEARAEHIAKRLKAYHEAQAKLLAQDQPAGELAWAGNGGRGKRDIERAVELVVSKGKVADPNQGKVQQVVPRPAKAADLAGWKELVEDTRINESMRRRAIHDKFASAGRVTPDGIKKWLFKEVLAADLDDPTLGIDKLLDKDYPFADEDRPLRR